MMVQSIKIFIQTIAKAVKASLDFEKMAKHFSIQGRRDKCLVKVQIDFKCIKLYSSGKWEFMYSCYPAWKLCWYHPDAWTRYVDIEKLTAVDLKKIKLFHPRQYSNIVAKLIARKMGA